ncbi:MAG: hypothetical protein IJV98_01710 [Clostridia bacterium]|nr:hypothetical protein [Clostridia bacterium]
MYCIKCGVELASSESRCPLCQTVVYHPDLDTKPTTPPYPPNAKPKLRVNRLGALLIVSALYLMLILQLLVCDATIFGGFTWSLYASGALILSYVIMILPSWFPRPNPVIFVPCDFASVALYLLMIDLITDGGWFLSFAFPMIGVFAFIVTAVITLCRYVKRGYFYILGGAFIAGGASLLLLEFLMYLTFAMKRFYFWSVYPLIGFTLVGLALIVIGICRPLRESLAKKFFL